MEEVKRFVGIDVSLPRRERRLGRKPVFTQGVESLPIAILGFPGFFNTLLVAKAALDVFIGSDGAAFSVTNDEVGIRELLGQLKPTDFVILEATGGLETPVASALAAAGIAVAIVNPRQVRDFARATGRLAKTDALDAEVLARFGEAVRPQARPLADEQAQALEALVTRRRQLVEMLTAEKNRRTSAPKVLHRSIDEHIRWLEKRLSGFDDELGELIRDTPLWRSATSCCVPCRVSARCFRVLCSPTCPSWARLIANRLPPWPDWRHLTATAEPCTAAAVTSLRSSLSPFLGAVSEHGCC